MACLACSKVDQPGDCEGSGARGVGGEDQDRRQRAPRQPGIGAAARRHGHERGAEDQPHLPAPDRDRRPVRRRRPPSRALRRALMRNRRVLLASRPERRGERRRTSASRKRRCRSPREGEVLVKNLWLSLDPYMRGRMSDAKSYVKGVELGEVMVGQTVGEVLESRTREFKAGDKVLTQLGWQLYGVTREADEGRREARAAQLLPRRPRHAGHDRVLRPEGDRPAEARARPWSSPRRRARWAASSASSRRSGAAARSASPAAATKCDYVMRELGFDACVDYKAGDLHGSLQAGLPERRRRLLR